MFHLYGLFIGIGVISGLSIVQYQAKRFKVSATFIENALLWIMIPAIIGARTYHVITDWHLYVGAPIFDLFKVWNGGLGFFGALVGGLIGILLYSHQTTAKTTEKKTISRLKVFFTMLDLLSFGVPLAQAIGRFGNYFNQELYGLPTDLPWGITINSQKYHPLFAYEAILNLVVFIFLNWLGRKKKLVIGKGQYACLYLASYGLIRFWLEFLRIEAARWQGALSVFSIAQWIGLGITVTALTVFWLRRHSDRGIAWEFKTLV